MRSRVHVLRSLQYRCTEGMSHSWVVPSHKHWWTYRQIEMGDRVVSLKTLCDQRCATSSNIVPLQTRDWSSLEYRRCLMDSTSKLSDVRDVLVARATGISMSPPPPMSLYCLDQTPPYVPRRAYSDHALPLPADRFTESHVPQYSARPASYSLAMPIASDAPRSLRYRNSVS